ncbi:MAG: patatin family protein [Oscillospiraceae bacterium]
MKTGLVLEGGAMRGMFTAGVLDVFLDNDITADCIVGVSAGALFGVNFLSGQKGRVIRYNKRFNKDKNYMGLLPLIREGNIVSTKMAYDEVPRVLDPFDDEEYKKSPVPFFAVMTDIETGEPEYVRINSVFEQMDTLRASGSMPFVSKPVMINGRKYLDGGISDSIPFEWLCEQGYDRLIVILTRDMEYRKKPMNKALVKTYGSKYPKVAEKLLCRHDLYNRSVERLKEWEQEGRAFVIRPSQTIDIGRIEKNPEKLQSVYDLGLRDAKAQLERLREFMKKSECYEGEAVKSSL